MVICLQIPTVFEQVEEITSISYGKYMTLMSGRQMHTAGP